jgi:hypothetical protein
MYRYLRKLIWQIGLKVKHTIGLLTNRYRMTPKFLIIGTQKGGTSSLYYYLKFHSEIKRPIRKEVHYFNTNYNKGNKWYKAHFPLKSSQYITGEATPDYVFHLEVPSRVKAFNHDMKLILLVRDPIIRAYSAYQMNRRMGIEERQTFEDAINYELENQDKYGNTTNEYREKHFYLARGLYAKQLSLWNKEFEKSKIYVVKSEDFFLQTKETLANIHQFLGINNETPPTLKPMNVGSYPPLSENTYNNLKEYFQEDARLLKSEWQIEF